MGIEVFRTVIVKQFFPWFDRAFGHDENPPAPYLHLTIRPAGMIDVARDVRLLPAVYRFCLSDLEEIFAPARAELSLGHTPSRVLDDALAFLDTLDRKEASPRS
jgi:hypothetical protein